MTKQEFEQYRNEALALFERAGVHVDPSELSKLKMVDFGMGNFRKEGTLLLDFLMSSRLRITILSLLPNQTLPEHMHPAYLGEAGKEETVRVLYGTMKVYLPGDSGADLNIPEGKEAFYTARKEVVLKPVQQITVEPGTVHWFQAGPEGAVTYGFYNRVDEDQNVFTADVGSGCLVGFTEDTYE